MDILVCAATTAEIRPFTAYLLKSGLPESKDVYALAEKKIRLLITGVGAVAAAFSLARELALRPYNLAIQAGIAGSFSPDLPIGTVVTVGRDIMADMGAEGPEGFLHLSELDFAGNNRSMEDHWIARDHRMQGLALPGPTVDAITVNTVSGSAETIRLRHQKFKPAIETMEGFAFHYACSRNGIPFVQIRSISNQVEIRDKSKWNIPLAIEQLNRSLITLVEKL